MARPETRSAPVRSAWRKGFSAGRRDVARETNPYRRHEGEIREISDMIGWPRLYAQTWDDGWADGQAQLAEEAG